MNIIFKTFLSVVVFLAAQSAVAVQQVDIYTQSILVEKNANATRVSEVRRQAMLQALQGATLIYDVDKFATIKSGLANHKQYILSEKVNSSDEVFISVIGQKIPMIELEIQFDSKKLTQLLLKANISTLDTKRPETLAVIMVQHKDGTTQILSRKYSVIQDDDGELDGQSTQIGVEQSIEDYELIAQKLTKDASALKLPVVWPIMDSQDLFFFDQRDFWQVDKERIVGFAKRYSVQIIMIARIKEHDDGRFIGEWNVLDLGRPKVQYYNSLELFTDAGLKQLSQAVMQQYGINPNDNKDEQVLVRMKQVDSVSGFHKNEVFLKGISGVKSVNALTVNGFEVTYILQLNVSQKQFVSSLELTDGVDFLIEDELRRPVMIDVVINNFE